MVAPSPVVARTPEGFACLRVLLASMSCSITIAAGYVARTGEPRKVRQPQHCMSQVWDLRMAEPCIDTPQDTLPGHLKRQQQLQRAVHGRQAVRENRKGTMGHCTCSAGSSASEPSMAARQLRVQASFARRGHAAAPVLPPLTSSPLWLRPPLPLPLLLLLPASTALSTVSHVRSSNIGLVIIHRVAGPEPSAGRALFCSVRLGICCGHPRLCRSQSPGERGHGVSWGSHAQGRARTDRSADAHGRREQVLQLLQRVRARKLAQCGLPRMQMSCNNYIMHVSPWCGRAETASKEPGMLAALAARAPSALHNTSHHAAQMHGDYMEVRVRFWPVEAWKWKNGMPALRWCPARQMWTGRSRAAPASPARGMARAPRASGPCTAAMHLS